MREKMAWLRGWGHFLIADLPRYKKGRMIGHSLIDFVMYVGVAKWCTKLDVQKNIWIRVFSVF